jgi:outer membrane autotransporter protein
MAVKNPHARNEYARRADLLRSTSSLAISVASMIVALGICVPGDARAQTTVNPVQTTAFTLTPAQNPIIFGPGTNIDTTATANVDAVDGDANTTWTVTNQGKLSGSGLGVFLLSAGSSLTNSGTISGGNNRGVQLFNGGTLVNQAGGTISSGSSDGVTSNGAGTITNAGTITGGSNSAGVLFTGNNGTVTNTGTISGKFGVDMVGPGGTVTNAGTINGSGGASGPSVSFEGSGTNMLTLQTGSVLNGDAVGSTAAGAINNLVLQGNGTANNNFFNFNSLDVNGNWALNGIAQIGAATVLNGGTLSGKGSIGGDVFVNGGGRLAPGSPLGALSVSGNVTFTPGSTFFVTATPTQASSLLVTGKATLSGGTVNVNAQNATYNPSHQYPILSAAGGLVGGFIDVTTNLTFLKPSLSQNANDVILTLDVVNNGGGTGGGATGGTGNLFATVAQTRNQAAVANALDPNAATNPIVLAVLNQTTTDGARQAFDALSGEVFGSVHNVQAGETQFARSAMLGRMRQASYAGTVGDLGALAFGGPELAYAGADANAAYAADIRPAMPGKAPARERSRDLTFWAQGLGGWGHTDSDGNAASVSGRFGGFLSGVDARFGETLRAGFVAGYLRSDLNTDARSSSAGIDSVQIGAYAGGRLGVFNVRTGASYSFDSIDTSRAIVFPGFSDQTKASFHGNVGQVFGEISYGMTLGHVAVEPLAGLAYVHVHDGSFLESGGAAALSGFSTHENIGYSFLGFRAATVLPLANGTALVPRASVQWQHAFGDVTPVAGLAFQGTGTAFSVAGVPIARNAALIETGFDWRFSPQAKLGAYYQGELAAHAESHAFKGAFSWNF